MLFGSVSAHCSCKCSSIKVTVSGRLLELLRGSGSDLVAIQTARGVVQSIRSCWWPIRSTHTHPTPAIIHTQPTTPHHHELTHRPTPPPPHPFGCAEACTQCHHAGKVEQACTREVHRPCVGVRAGCMSVGCGHARVCVCLFVCV